MSISLKGILLLLTFLSLSLCYAGDRLPDYESHDIMTLEDDYRGVRGVKRLSESKGATPRIEISLPNTAEELSTRSNLTSSSATPTSRSIHLPAFTTPLKKGDTIMVLEDTDSSRKMLVIRLKRLGFNVIESTYGYQAYNAAQDAAANGVEISLFLFDFNVPFKKDEIAVRKSCGQHEWNGGETARLIKQIELDNNTKPFESSVFACLTGTPEDTEGYEDIFWQVRNKLVEPNADQFFEDVRRHLTTSELASFMASVMSPQVIKQGIRRTLSRLLKEKKILDI